VTDNAGLTLRTSQVVSITAGSVVPSKTGTNFLHSNSSGIILILVLAPVLVVLLVFRKKIHLLVLQKRIEASHRRIAQLSGDTAEINSILGGLFGGMKNKSLKPRWNSVLNVYNGLIVGKVEANAAFRPPDLSIDEIEKRVDRLIHSKIEEEVDKM
jgi:hypothetical protein